MLPFHGDHSPAIRCKYDRRHAAARLLSQVLPVKIVETKAVRGCYRTAIAPYWVMWYDWAIAIPVACRGAARTLESRSSRSSYRVPKEVCQDTTSLCQHYRSPPSQSNLSFD